MYGDSMWRENYSRAYIRVFTIRLCKHAHVHILKHTCNLWWPADYFHQVLKEYVERLANVLHAHANLVVYAISGEFHKRGNPSKDK
jgi:hypothetical protein